ncbi:MAG TPA: alpha/beta hydrolase, partial [Polyangiaceae bacterium]|nr:alpha/beta hydrolase [Polyangiaceae bacterium]
DPPPQQIDLVERQLMAKLRALLFGMLSGAALLAPAAALAAGPPPRALTFASVNGAPLLLDLYLPESRAGGAAPAPFGLIIWVHGGAWRAGSRASVDLLGMTARGWAVASVDYRLSPVARFPAQVHDIKAAIRFLRAHAAEYGYPPSRFVVAGSSAGGHLAALVGVSNHQRELEGGVGSDSATSSDVQAVVSLYGASNLASILGQSSPHGLSVRVPALELLLGGQPEAVPELARLASPVFHVDATDPPLLLLHGDQDNQMPIQQSQELEAAYQKLRLAVEFGVVRGAGHGGPAFTNPDTLERIDRFLRRQFGQRVSALSGSPEPAGGVAKKAPAPPARDAH